MIGLLLSFFIGFNAQANCEKRYALGFINTEPAFYLSSTGQKSGLSYEIMQELIKRLGCKSTEMPGSHAWVQEKLSRNLVDIYGLTSRSETLGRNAEFVPVYKIPRHLLIRSQFVEKGRDYKYYIESSKVVFANVIGAFLFFDSNEQTTLKGTQRLKDFPSAEDAYKAFRDGRVGAVFSSPLYTHYYVSKYLKSEPYTVIREAGIAIESGFYLSKLRLSQKDKERVTTILTEIKKDGTLEKLAAKYVNPEDLQYYRP